MKAEPGGDGRERWRWAFAAAGLVSFLPFVRSIVLGRAFYFRDLSGQFFPLRRFAMEGLLRGEFRYWDPYVHEGVPLSLPALAYWGDLLQLFLHREWGLSLLLALHVPLAAIAFVALARHLGVGAVGATLGGLVFALGGFSLSSLNLYVYVQALAWSPLVVLTLLRTAEDGRGRIAMAAIVGAIALSTTGVEIVGQAIACGLVLWTAPLRRTWRAAAALALATGLAAPTLLVMRSMIGGTARGAGFSSDVVLAHSVHPLTFLQVLVGNLYCDLSSPAALFWGSNFFPRGFPYVLSLYLGASVVGLALLGATSRSPVRGRLLALAGLGVLLCLGRWGPIAPIVDAVPATFRVFRYPTKAFFLVELSLAVLAGAGLHGLVGIEGRRGWRRLALVLVVLGGLLAMAPWTPGIAPGATRTVLHGFFPPDYPWALRLALLERVLADAAVGGSVALSGGLIAFAVVADRLRPAIGGVALIGLVSADLLRTGVGLNPTVTPAFFELSSEMTAVADSIRVGGGRAFTCDIGESPAYRLSRARAGHEMRTFAALRETLTPFLNVPHAVPTALSPDLTMLVALERLLPTSASCARFDELAPRLRASAVSHVLSLDPLASPELREVAALAPLDLAPLPLYVYTLRDPIPRVSLEGEDGGPVASSDRVVSLDATPDRMALVVETSRPARVVIRDSYAAGWTATVDDAPTPLLRVEGGYRGVLVSAGRRRIALRYRPPGLIAGIVLAIGSAATTLWLWRTRFRPRPPIG